MRLTKTTKTVTVQTIKLDTVDKNIKFAMVKDSYNLMLGLKKIGLFLGFIFQISVQEAPAVCEATLVSLLILLRRFSSRICSFWSY